MPPAAPATALTMLCLAMLALPGLARAQETVAAAPAVPERQVTIEEYLVRGNTVLDARAIEAAVTPFLGPGRTLKDVEGARDALVAAYQARGYQSVYVDLPEQQVEQGVVVLQVSETKVGRLRVVGAQNRVNPGLGNVTSRDIGPSAGFAVFSLNGGYRINDHLQLSAGIDNLFDRAYSEHLNLAGSADFGYPADPVRINEPGRNAWLKLSFQH